MLDVLRQEIKYHITVDCAEKMFFTLSQVMQGDPFNGNNAYMVRSLYFDSFYDNDYWEKSAGLNYRKKIRLRVYSPDNQTAKLEMKEKIGSDQRKRSLTVKREDAQRLIQGDITCLNNYQEPLAEELFYIMRNELYVPRCVVEYKRRAFMAPVNDIRITFDSEIESNEGDFDIFDKNLCTYPVMSKGELVLEVKYNNFLLSYIKDMLEQIDATETSNSKYCLARKLGLGSED